MTVEQYSNVLRKIVRHGMSHNNGKNWTKNIAVYGSDKILTRRRCWNTVVTKETTKKQIPITMPHVAAIGSRRCEPAASVGRWHHRRYGWKDAAMLAWLLAMRVYDSDGDRKPAPASTASPPNTPHGTQHLTHENTTTATARVSRLLTTQQHNEAGKCHSHWFTQENTGERTS